MGKLHAAAKRLPAGGPRAHRIPCHVMWGITALTAVFMAALNFATIWAVHFLVEWKFEAMQAAIEAHGVWQGVAALVGTCAAFASVGTCLVHAFSPDAGGSGAPENKGWLNGSRVEGFFTERSLAVRAGAVVLANASGYPVGREGPSVTMGSNVAFLVTRALAFPHVRRFVDVDVSGWDCRPVRVVDEEQLAHAQRVGGAVGGACAMAMIFDAPIGGVLYMLEEITVTAWPMELTFRAFVGTMICTMLSYFLLNLCGTSLKAFVLYDRDPEPSTWQWRDVPFFLLLAAVLGPFSACHTRWALAVGSLRSHLHSRLCEWQPYARMAEAVLFAAFCAGTCAAVSLLAECDEDYKDQPFVALSYVRFNCDEGAFNPVASLLLTTSEGAVQRLFSRTNAGDISPANTLAAFVAYTFLNVGLTGVPVPSGNFTGAMLIGGLAGRSVGALVARYGPEGVRSSGVYAMVGSAAMLAGFKQIAMGVVVFVIEAANDLSLTMPLMLSVAVSLLLNRLCSRAGFDEEQIRRKGIPFLPAEPPQRLARARAADLCDRLPQEAVLAPEAPPSALRRALEQRGVATFPVVRDRRTCVGFTTRARLEAALRWSDRAPGRSAPGGGGGSPRLLGGRPWAKGRHAACGPGAGAEAADGAVCVDRLCDPVPYMIAQDAPVARFYSLFTKASASALCVTTGTGEFRGMISRGAFVDTVRRAEEEEGAIEAAEDDDEGEEPDASDGEPESDGDGSLLFVGRARPLLPRGHR